MRTGNLFQTITIKVITETVTSGDVTQVLSAGVTVRAAVKQIDGTRYLASEELVDREVYEIITWDKSLGSNLQITYGTKTLYPILPPTVNADKSYRGTVKIIAATKV